MGIQQTLCEYNGFLYAFWKGETNDDRLFWSRYDGSNWSVQQVVAGNSSVGPSAAVYGGRLFLSWKGTHDDQRIFCLQIDHDHWFPQAPIGAAFNSSHGPALAAFNGRLYAAWKGMYDDQTVWFASTDNATWSGPTPIPGAFSTVGPSLAVSNGRLFAAFKGAGNDQGIYMSSTADGRTWTTPSNIPGVATSVGPSLTAVPGQVYAMWKGMTADEKLWWSAFNENDAQHRWAPQAVVPGGMSSVGAALGSYRGVPTAMWKGPGTNQGLSFSQYSPPSLFKPNGWSAPKVVPGNSGQDLPVNIGVPLQYQETSLWCWLACAASVAHYYDPHSTANQPDMITTIGRQMNNFGNISCAPTAAMLNNHPGLAAELANPYGTAAEFCLEKIEIPTVCKKSGGVADALNVNGNWSGVYKNKVTLAEITSEIHAGRPLCVDISWKSGEGSHVVIIAGVLDDRVLILDPGNGETVIPWEIFPDQYLSGATRDGMAFTKHK
jgi:hypothetical protein